MRKIFLLISIVFIGVSCSSDDKEDIKDPVFDSEFTPLKSLDEINGVYTYTGAKIGNRPFGILNGDNCLGNNIINFGFPGNRDYNNRVFTYISYKPNVKIANACTIDFTRTIWGEDFLENGETVVRIYVKITDEYFINEINSNEDNTDNETVTDKIELEIGMQAGYLRIEDKLSRNTLKEKSYLYFKKS